MQFRSSIFFLFAILCALIGSVSSSASNSDEELPKLRIGITKKIPAEDCKRKARAGDMVAVHYTGSFLDGNVFDSSVQRGTPLTFPLGKGNVIAGWDQGILGMCIGEQRKLTIPPHLAYGKNGAGSVIPPDATLVFTTELVDILGYKHDEL
ncbi:hypothetical protein NADFUDRAFT_44626 [Nadsonia fulvescens var. elongata DSM 6958]|uniref:peptidylprolyl isomerase n=1 Tax=Nadsonia fulvescens var. elongata DSM 6958 TaxID=857566 RepID=A0A1E3PR64_9ASCO|nr:hypothetical protein NADFUDRAFT_44626 [Nadsonia fulvescens var. elongata DSM 6958]